SEIDCGEPNRTVVSCASKGASTGAPAASATGGRAVAGGEAGAPDRPASPRATSRGSRPRSDRTSHVIKPLLRRTDSPPWYVATARVSTVPSSPLQVSGNWSPDG